MYLEERASKGANDQRAVLSSVWTRWTYQVLWRREWSPSLSVISAAFMALGRSWRARERKEGQTRSRDTPRHKVVRTCLLAKTRRRASRSSSSFNIRPTGRQEGKRRQGQLRPSFRSSVATERPPPRRSTRIPSSPIICPPRLRCKVKRLYSRSSRASETRSRSLESTTKMIPWVFWKSG